MSSSFWYPGADVYSLSQFINPAAIGIDCTGITDTTVALQAATTAGLKLLFPPASVCLITRGINLATGAAWVSPIGKMILRAKTGLTGFNIKTTAVPRTNLDRNMIVCSGIDDVTMHNIHLQTDGLTECVIHGIRLIDGFADVGYQFTGMQFSRMCNGMGFAFNSAGSAGTAKKRIIQIDSAVDFVVTQGLGYFDGAQSSVIEIDNDISGAASAPASIKIGMIKNVLYSGQALIDFGQQTDGVNIVAQGALSAKNFDIEIDTVEGVGEVVDIQGFSNNIRIGTIKRSYLDAVKIIHGGSYNSIKVGTMEQTGRSAAAIFGSDSVITANDSIGNSIHIGTLITPGSYGIGPANGYAVLFGGNLTFKPKRNTIRIDEIVGDGVNLDNVVSDGTTDTGNGNIVHIGRATGFIAPSVSAPPGNVQVFYGQRCFTKLALVGNQSIPNATATKIAWAEILTELESIADLANNQIKFLWPGVYEIKAQVRLDTIAVGANDRYEFQLRQNATQLVVRSGRINFGAKDESPSFDATVYIDSDDIGGVNANLSLWFTQDTGVAKNISDVNNVTFLTVTRVS